VIISVRTKYVVPDSQPVQLCVIPRSHINTIQLVRLLFKANQLNRVYTCERSVTQSCTGRLVRDYSVLRLVIMPIICYYVFALPPIFSCVEGFRNVLEIRAPVVKSAQFFLISYVKVSAQTFKISRWHLQKGVELSSCRELTDVQRCY
jgi:hypothetical protein